MGPTKMLALAGAATALITTTAATAADFPAAAAARNAARAGRRHRRLVSARRHRHRPTSASSRSTSCSPRRPNLAGDLATSISEGLKDTPSSASASATSGTTGCASTSPANIAANVEFHGVRQLRPTALAPRFNNYDGQQVGVGGAGQRLSRSRHLVVPHAVHRRRRRRRLASRSAASAMPASSPTAHRLRRRSAYADAASKWNFAWALHAGLAYKVTNDLQGRVRLPLPQSGRRRRPATSSRFDGTQHRSAARCTSRTSPRTTSSSACAGCSSPSRSTQPPLMRRG